MYIPFAAEHAANVFGVLAAILQGNHAFAVGRETSAWAHGLRFTIYDVRSATESMPACPFDEISMEIEEALKDAGYPVSGIMKGAKLCMLDVDCRARQIAVESEAAGVAAN